MAGNLQGPMNPKRQATNPAQLKLFEPAEPSVDTWQPVRDDFNFCRLAMFVASDHRADRFRDIHQTYDVTLDGKQFSAVWEVRHDPQLGLLGSFDRDVWLGIMELAAEANEGGRRSTPEILHLGSSKGFLRKIGKPQNGKYISMLNDSIRRFVRTVCFSEKAFNCPTSGGYLHLLENLTLVTAAGFKGELDNSGEVQKSTWIRLSDYVRKNLDSGYIALIDVKYVRSLSGEISKQLYPFLSYRFWLAAQKGRDHYISDWQDLRDYLASNGWDSLSRARDRLKSAIQELIARQYLHPDSQWQGDNFVFKMGDKFLDELRTRVNAKDQFSSWIASKPAVKQLSCLPARLNSPIVNAGPDDERETILTRQAIRISVLGQSPDVDLLNRYGWTLEDAHSLAARLKTNQQR